MRMILEDPMNTCGSYRIDATATPGTRQELESLGFCCAQRKGFALIEVCVSALILMLLTAGVMGVMTAGRRGASLAENKAACLHIARQVIEGLRILSYDAPELNVGTTPLPANRGYYVVAEDADGWTKDITVVINWVEPWGGARSVSLVTSMSRSLHR
jgi:type II secretory pathway pseudopilin PulG